MTNLPGNHYMQKLVNEGMPRSSESLATLALAYEQRTANLIAYAEQMRRDRTSGTNAATTEVLMTVEARLGLGTDQ